MKSNALKTALIVFSAALLGGVFSLGGYLLFADQQPVNTRQIQKKKPVSKFADYKVKQVTMPSFNFSEVSKEVLPTVVHIQTSVKIDGPSRQFPFFEGFPEMRRGSGSGVIFSKDGYIVTNNHVIQNASEIKVTLHDKRTFDATVVGTDESTDLAVLKINAENLKPVDIGSSEDLQIGEWVLAVGNPFNLTSTITAGIVSAKARNLNLLGGGSHIESFIQTDAAVNPGNSGGALVNVEGNLVGINTAIASKTGQYAGYAFAIPSSIVNKVVTDIIKYGEVKRGFLGVSIQSVNDEIAKKENLEEIKGVLVRGIMENSAAEKANIQKGDVIVAVNGEKINSVPELQAIIGQKHPGDKVEVTIQRGDEKIQKEVTLRNRQGVARITTTKAPSELMKQIGAEFEALNPTTRQKLGIDYGVKVSDVTGGKFAQVGIPENFIILQINKEPVYNKEDVYKILKNNKGGVLIEGINPDGSKGYYGFPFKYEGQ